MSFADKTLTCRDCATNFVWTAGEQEFYASRGLENAPSRCPACRAERRRNGGGGGMGGGMGSGTGTRQMYPAVCASCGQETEVPFQPRQDRPVYCSSCFQKRRGER